MLETEGRKGREQGTGRGKSHETEHHTPQPALTIGNGFMAGVIPAMLASGPDLEEVAMDVVCPMGLERSDGAVEGDEPEEGAMAASIPVNIKRQYKRVPSALMMVVGGCDYPLGSMGTLDYSRAQINLTFADKKCQMSGQNVIQKCVDSRIIDLQLF